MSILWKYCDTFQPEGLSAEAVSMAGDTHAGKPVIVIERHRLTGEYRIRPVGLLETGIPDPEPDQ